MNFSSFTEGMPPQNRVENEPLDEGDLATLRLCGAHGSPYTNKILALMRYRRLPHRFLTMGHPEETGTQHPPVHPAAQRLLPKIGGFCWGHIDASESP